MRGDFKSAEAYLALAQNCDSQWVVEDLDEASKDHYKLQYDKPNSWSVKYNIWWQKRLGLNVFKDSDMLHEFTFYATKFNEYGIPLDSSAGFSKDNWVIWAASVSPKPLFDSIITSIWKFADITVDRCPLTDWYDTVTAKRTGFHCRPVLWAFFAPLPVSDSFPMKSSYSENF